jgi:hypothetical protein
VQQVRKALPALAEHKALQAIMVQTVRRVHKGLPEPLVLKALQARLVQPDHKVSRVRRELMERPAIMA